MKISKNLILLFLSVICLLSAPAFSKYDIDNCKVYSPQQLDQKDPVKMLHTVVNSLLNCLHENKAKIADVKFMTNIINQQLVPHADFTRMTMGVLGRNWRSATPVEQTEFEQELKQLVIRTYTAALKNFKDHKLEIKNSVYNREKDKIEIRSIVISKSAPEINIDYRLANENGQWKVYDLIVEDVSLVHSFRTQFADKIRKEGVRKVIDDLKELNEKGQVLKEDTED